jgi:ABC-type dipeptide/oligopeptide/nickel transport system permease component
MGVVAALYRGKWLDHLLSVLAVGGISIPVFWLGLLLMFLFSLKLHWLPVAGNATWRHYIMPTFCLSVYSVAFITRMARSTVLDVLGSDYVRTAKSKGLRPRIINIRHVVRNALIPLITTVGLRFGYMLGGAVVTETVFAWPGVGRLLVIAVTQRDIPVVQGILLVFASVFVLVNIIVDVSYSVADPRLSY